MNLRGEPLLELEKNNSGGLENGANTQESAVLPVESSNHVVPSAPAFTPVKVTEATQPIVPNGKNSFVNQPLTEQTPDMAGIIDFTDPMLGKTNGRAFKRTSGWRQLLKFVA
jgi:hypothetical protein